MAVALCLLAYLFKRVITYSPVCLGSVIHPTHTERKRDKGMNRSCGSASLVRHGHRTSMALPIH
ncbi:hypothetical protein HALO59_20176 [Halomonas sp. 59]|nr:hypothetical protein HALO113_20176 [Halomonas sp. 113]CAD5271159.1 hypothetical protein HALO59_20176 [Halomonas sp. 59]VXB72761.1 hypothetical protein HALO153_20174 [Halomonas titanicae]VXB75131.1 hypothetical protein HALO98_20109 [Halomonas titanicae]